MEENFEDRRGLCYPSIPKGRFNWVERPDALCPSGAAFTEGFQLPYLRTIIYDEKLSGDFVGRLDSLQGHEFLIFMDMCSTGHYPIVDGVWKVIVWWHELEDVVAAINSGDIFVRVYSIQSFEGAYRLVVDETRGTVTTTITSISETSAMRLWAHFGNSVPTLFKDAILIAVASKEIPAEGPPEVAEALSKLSEREKVIFHCLLESAPKPADGIEIFYADSVDLLDGIWNPRDDPEAGPSAFTVYKTLKKIRDLVSPAGFYFVPKRTGSFYWLSRPS